MGFFAPWFLVGFLALGIPTFVHLLRKHVTIPRPVSSLMFFERGTQSSTRHRRLRYLLLFALRLLLVLLIVLAFANPYLRRPANANGSLLLIVLDNSFSMRAGNRFMDAKRQALETLASKPRSQRAQVIALGGQVQLLTQPVSDSEQLKTALDNIDVGDGHASFAGLGRSVHALSESSPVPMDLHLFSDMQSTAMPDNFADAVLPANVKLTLHSVSGNSASPNWTIESLSAPAELTDPKDSTNSRVKAVVAGFTSPQADKTISLVVNGRPVASRTITVPENGRTPIEFAPIDVNYGFNRCEIRIEGSDSLPADDTARFVIRRVDPQRVLFVHSAADLRSPAYFGAALNAATHGAFGLQPMVVEQTTNLEPAKFAFIVLSDATSLPSIFEHTLEQYVSKGGNVFIALGLDAERRKHIPLWSSSLEQAHTFGPSGAVGIGIVDFTFPPLEQDKPGRDNGGWAATKVLYAAVVDSKGARVTARLSDGTPLLLERQVGEGRVLLFTSGLENLTNDLPIQPVFVPFVDKMTRYLSGSEQLSGSRIVDSFVQLRASSVAPGKAANVEVIDPEGRRPLSLSEASIAQSFRLGQAGFYQIRFANGRDTVVGVNPDRTESDLTPISPEIQSLWIGSDDSRRGSERVVASNPDSQNLSLWWYIMLLAFTVAVAETLLSSRYLGTRREDI
ncbi:vWA domain-containing protein [Edaphobacter aggregans]|uniref:vWA domain-containing protein n=1 Tax=Edaphobacter aggregans TaxID=570835 RepID=UPI00055721A4|nr:BatA and WFA domain-containing protein [Edaphobacter aggregans]